jgi:putative flippase GtrA
MANMMTFTKAQLVSLLASSVDFGVTLALVQGLGFPHIAGSATGTISGGATHFMISRNWVFSAQEDKWAAQLTRYMLVWVGNFVLNVTGLWLLTRYTGMNYLLAKTIIAILIAVFYNYVLQKRYVFK